MIENIDNLIKLDARLLEAAKKAEEDIKPQFELIDDTAFHNEAKVLSAFRKNRVSEVHFKGSTGYGYDDAGRETLDKVYADVFGAEDALVRHNFVSGTHALSVALFGVLRPGDTIVSLTGKPYDTMEEVIGIRGGKNGSLKDFGVLYRQVDLLRDGGVDLDGIKNGAAGAKVAYIQRSRGYSLRPSLSVAKIAEMISVVRSVNPDALVIVDNCYGEFVEKTEPTAAGADLIVGSLIKNPGGAIAQTGGYIAGRKDLVELCSYRLTCVGMGKEVGCTLDQSRSMFMGIFMAPSVVAAALKTSVFACRLFNLLGFETFPAWSEPRTDIIAAIKLNTPEKLISFCEGIQAGSPVDSFVAPIPWAMPGYDSEVIMAAGAFTMGASIEISADAPLREPYAVWLQGGVTYNTGKIAVLTAAQRMFEKNQI